MSKMARPLSIIPLSFDVLYGDIAVGYILFSVVCSRSSCYHRRCFLCADRIVQSVVRLDLRTVVSCRVLHRLLLLLLLLLLILMLNSIRFALAVEVMYLLIKLGNGVRHPLFPSRRICGDVFITPSGFSFSSGLAGLFVMVPNVIRYGLRISVVKARSAMYAIHRNAC